MDSVGWIVAAVLGVLLSALGLGSAYRIGKAKRKTEAELEAERAKGEHTVEEVKDAREEVKDIEEGRSEIDAAPAPSNDADRLARLRK